MEVLEEVSFIYPFPLRGFSRPISIAVPYIFPDSERDAGGWLVQKWQFQPDVIIEQPLKAGTSVPSATRMLLLGTT